MRNLKPPKNKRIFTPRCCSTCKHVKDVTWDGAMGAGGDEQKCMRDGHWLDDSRHETVCDGWKYIYA